MRFFRAPVVIVFSVLGLATAFVPAAKPMGVTAPARRTEMTPLFAGEADITFPGNKKIKGKAGESLKALAAKAKANINYGCEEGKCGACEAVGSDGKKYRICVAKVPASAAGKSLVLK